MFDEMIEHKNYLILELAKYMFGRKQMNFNSRYCGFEYKICISFSCSIFKKNET